MLKNNNEAFNRDYYAQMVAANLRSKEKKSGPTVVGQSFTVPDTRKPAILSSATVQNIKPGSLSNTAKEEISSMRDNRTKKPANVEPEIGEETINIDEDAPPIMRHRLRNNLGFWKSFCRCNLVLAWIASGFDLRWKPETGPPPSMFLPNQVSAYENSAFVSAQIKDLVAAKALEPCSFKPYLVSPLGVTFKKSNGKPRLILDLRFLNKFSIVPSFKYEGLETVAKVLQPQDFMVTTDYHSGYHHIDVHKDFWKFLGIEWQGQFYTYTCLPFGLAAAPWAFTKVTRELLCLWRRDGFRNCGYLDDAIHMDQCPVRLQHFVNSRLIPDTEKAGFIIKSSKSHLSPETRQTFLGVLVDTMRGCFIIPEEKRTVIALLLHEALNNKNSCPVQLLEKLTGNIAAIHWAFGQLSRLMSMSLYADMAKAKNRWSSIALSEASIQDLLFWKEGFDAFNGFKPLWEPTGFSHTFYTDAAGSNLKNFGGWAGWTESHGRKLIAKGIWTGDEILDHSTTQELSAVFHTIKSFNRNSELWGKRILVKTDNQAVFFIINKAGSRDAQAHYICKQLLWYCISNTITLVAQWIPRENNEFADFYSKMTDMGDWKLDPQVFKALNRRWGPFEVDLFASFENHQVEKYYSRFFTPSCTAVDAFAQDWSNIMGWCNPPFSLLSRVLIKGRQCGARMCLICPFTPSATWWPLLISPHEQGAFQNFVLAAQFIGRRHNLFLPGTMAHAYANRIPAWDCLALLIDFKSPLNTLVRVPYRR